MTKLVVRADAPAPWFEWAANLLGSFIGIQILVDHQATTPDLYYGNRPEQEYGLRFPDRETDYTRETIPIEFDKGDNGDDLFRYVHFWLTDQAHADATDDAFDPHDRLLPGASFQASRGQLNIPVVNAALERARQAILRHFPQLKPRPMLPEGKKAIVVLSHDVDEPINPDHLFAHFRQAVRAARHGRLPLAGELIRNTVKSKAKRVLRRAIDRHWLFDDVVAAEAKHNFRSTFYFATVSNTHRGANYLDVRYRASDAMFQSAFDRLRVAGSEIGLHISYEARDKPGAMAAERAELEALAGIPILGSRHHFWHMKRPFWPTLHAHAEAGLSYDSSIAFNGEPGFRLGMAFPFFPWDPQRKRVIDCLQIPAMAMDGGFFYDPTRDVDSALQEFAGLIKTLKANRGIAAIDWHARTSYPASTAYRKWGQAYLDILDLLAADPEIDVLPAIEVSQRIQQCPSRGPDS